MGTQATKNWRQGRSFVMPASRLTVCHKSVNPQGSLELVAYPAIERHFDLGAARVTSS